LEIINNNPSGPFIVAANDTRLALDNEMAQAILVTHSCRQLRERHGSGKRMGRGAGKGVDGCRCNLAPDESDNQDG